MVINGYTIPGKKGGIGVRKACQLVLNNPGIKTEDLHTEAAWFANLNLSTAGWIVSPKDGPVGQLWERRKEGRGFRHYPNEFTESAIGDLKSDSYQIALDSFIHFNKDIIGARQGDLIKQISDGKQVVFLGIRIKSDSFGQTINVTFIPDATVEAFNSLKDFYITPRTYTYVRFMSDGRIFETLPALGLLTRF